MIFMQSRLSQLTFSLGIICTNLPVGVDLHTFQKSQKKSSTRSMVATTTMGTTTARPSSGLHSKKPLHISSVGEDIAAETVSENSVRPAELLHLAYT